MEPHPDLKAEFIASSWLENDIPARQILFRPLGDFKRRSHRDIENTRELEIGNFKGRVIESNRSGIYDHLPEQLFHLPSSANLNSTKKKVDEIRLQREKEQQSRLFFLPLEHEFFLNRVSLARLEQCAWELVPGSGLLEELKAFWQAPSSLDESIFVQLLPFLPLVSENRGNLDKAAEIMSVALRVPVEIQTIFGLKYHYESNASMGDALLGADTSLGGELDTYLPQINVDIEIPDPAGLDKYLHNQNFDTLVTWLLGWFIPVEYDFVVSLKLSAEVSAFTLASDDGFSVPLGYATLAES
ncbi:type VI secretion system baseplate subunit TssG [Dyadobacter sp. BHUBP1]|uniref:type VI secretion system baseplate subunit TssG n=1 Tax=Dyadobacter sp. BHUBP1 TaxID=3424178 RepID=UPI003D342593